jgi:hypothetical protein
MAKISCPYCYQRIPAHRLWYQCTGRGSPGQTGCPKEVDETRQAMTGYAEQCRPSFPPPRPGPALRRATCPNCAAVSGIRVCPACHTPLSSNFGESASPLIAMVGAKGTGKTVYLTVLAHELRTNLRKRFAADVRLSGDRQGDATSPKQWLDQNVKAVYTNRRLFPQTAQAQNGRREPLVFEWRHEHRLLRLNRLRTFYLSFYDTAGEDLTSQGTAHDLTYLGAADALILLLDPFMLPQARNRLHLPKAAITSDEAAVDVLGRVTEMLRSSHGTSGRRRIRIPISVAFAKMDAFDAVLDKDHPLLRVPSVRDKYDDGAGQETHEHIRALLEDFGAGDVDTHLRLNYQNYRYFAVSALGAQPNYDTREVDRNGVHPFRVDEPLVWLLSRFGVVPTQGAR